MQATRILLSPGGVGGLKVSVVAPLGQVQDPAQAGVQQYAGYGRGAQVEASNPLGQLYSLHGDLCTATQTEIVGEEKIAGADNGRSQVDSIWCPEAVTGAQHRGMLYDLAGERDHFADDVGKVAVKSSQQSPFAITDGLDPTLQPRELAANLNHTWCSQARLQGRCVRCNILNEIDDWSRIKVDAHG